MDKCQWCSKKSDEYGMVALTLNENEPSISICNKCFNEYMADMLDVTDYDGFKKEVTFVDCDKIEHIFQIIKRITPVGVLWEAIEFLDEERIGYIFKMHQDFEDNPMKVLEELYKRIENGLSRKFIEKEISLGKEFSYLKEDMAEGRIEWDENYEGNIPKFNIDGEEYSLEELGRIMMAYEGWNFKLEITEPTE